MEGYIYQGLNNTFIIMKYDKIIDYSFLSNKICNENNLDGLIAISNERKLFFYNRDGSFALMCGNGIRCAANYLYENEKKENKYLFSTSSGSREVEVINYSPFISKANLGVPKIIKELSNIKSINIKGNIFNINALFLSTFHILILVDNVHSSLVDNHANEIFLHPSFDKKCNITFFQIIDNNTIRSRTFERGVGFTKSCATGAASSAYIAYLLHSLNKEITVKQEEGELKVSIENDVFIEGPSSFIRKITIDEK